MINLQLDAGGTPTVSLRGGGVRGSTHASATALKVSVQRAFQTFRRPATRVGGEVPHTGCIVLSDEASSTCLWSPACAKAEVKAGKEGSS